MSTQLDLLLELLAHLGYMSHSHIFSQHLPLFEYLPSGILCLLHLFLPAALHLPLLSRVPAELVRAVTLGPVLVNAGLAAVLLLHALAAPGRVKSYIITPQKNTIFRGQNFSLRKPVSCISNANRHFVLKAEV